MPGEAAGGDGTLLVQETSTENAKFRENDIIAESGTTNIAAVIQIVRTISR